MYERFTSEARDAVMEPSPRLGHWPTTTSGPSISCSAFSASALAVSHYCRRTSRPASPPESSPTSGSPPIAPEPRSDAC